MSLEPKWVASIDAVFRETPPDAPGCAVGVVWNGETAFARGYGLACLEHGVQITPSTRFYMASVSKQVTALAVLQAAEAECLGLNEPVRKWIPELPAPMDTVTLRHLLTHTGGVRDYFQLGFLAGFGAEYAFSERDVIAILARQTALNFDPGEAYLYSNSGYVLLSIALQRATGKRLDAFAREAIFEPLGMGASQFQHDHAAVVPDKAMGYEMRGGDWRVANSMLDVVGDGGMYASLQDMLAWTINLLAPRIGASAIGLMKAPACLKSGEFTGYGLGLGVGRHRGLATVGHTGGLAGYRTVLLAYPSEAFGVVILSNDATALPAQLARQVAEACLPNRMTPVSERAPAPSRDTLASLVGNYRATDGEIISLVERDGQLAIRGQPQSLIPIGSAAFAAGGDPDGLRVDFTEAEGGLTLSQSEGLVRNFRRCQPPTTFDRSGVVGEFASPEVGANCRIQRSGEDLAGSFANGPDIRLEPVASDCLWAPEFGAVLTFHRGKRNAVDGFRLDGSRARGLNYRWVSAVRALGERTPAG